MRISFIYMAPGFGGRFDFNRPLASFKGKEFYHHDLDCICQAAGGLEKEGHQTEVLVVSQYETILKQAESRGFLVVPNRFSGEGITASLRLGTSSASPEAEALLFSVTNQSYVGIPTLKEFVYDLRLSGKGVGCAHYQGRRGDPAVFSSFYGKEFMALRGDRGGSVIMRACPGDVWTTEVLEEELKDIDRTEDLGTV